MSTTNAHHITTIEISSITNFQRKLHGISLQKNESKGRSSSTEDEEHPGTRFRYDVLPSSWSANIREEIKSIKRGDTHHFQPNSKFDFLLTTTLTSEVPAIEVDDRYKGQVEIC